MGREMSRILQMRVRLGLCQPQGSQRWVVAVPGSPDGQHLNQQHMGRCSSLVALLVAQHVAETDTDKSHTC